MGIWDDLQKFLSGDKTEDSRTVEGKVDKPESTYYDRLRMVESSGGTNVVAKKGTALGPHQFTEGTWKDLTKKYKLNFSLEDRLDEQKSLTMLKIYTEENRTALKKMLSADPSDTDLYAAHFLGTAGARKFLKASPRQLAKDVVSKNAYKNNENIFYDKKNKKQRTVLEVYKLLQNKMGE